MSQELSKSFNNIRILSPHETIIFCKICDIEICDICGDQTCNTQHAQLCDHNSKFRQAQMNLGKK
jgi:hypothetical protein